MCEACKSDFGTVGDSPLSYVGSGAAHPNSKYTKSLKRNTMGTGASPTGKMASRSNIKLNEADGPKCSIQATLYKPNAAEASKQLRNTRLVKSAAGIKDFFVERSMQGQ